MTVSELLDRMPGWEFAGWAAHDVICHEEEEARAAKRKQGKPAEPEA